MTPEDVTPVNAWIRDCQVAWIVFASDAEAADFERMLHAEWMPLSAGDSKRTRAGVR
jgi:hypothetical protein